MTGPQLVETYPPEVAAIDPLATALRRLRTSLGDERSGFADAEDAAALRATLAVLGHAVVPAGLLDAAAALLRSDPGNVAMFTCSMGYGTLFETWPEADALAQALDTARPGWRMQADG